MTEKGQCKIAFALVSFAFFGGVLAWTTYYGNPANSLHVSAQSGPS